MTSRIFDVITQVETSPKSARGAQEPKFAMKGVSGRHAVRTIVRRGKMRWKEEKIRTI